LAAGIALPSHLNAFVVAIGTDGTDGPTDAAGAFTNYEQLQLAKQMGLKPGLFLNNNDAYHFFEQVNGLIKTGPTQTNVMDIVMVFIH
jgi:glycerate-2-kinase